VRVAAQVVGGPQERDLRGGTENVPGIVGMGVAAELAAAWLADGEGRARGAALRDRFESGVLAGVPDAVVNGAGSERLWNTTNVGFPGLEAEALLLLLSERGVAASAGAACSSGSLDPSPVLLAMGVPERVAHGSLRFSVSRLTSAAEVDHAVEAVAASVARLRRSA
jgi:cysteine desulfurase